MHRSSLFAGSSQLLRAFTAGPKFTNAFSPSTVISFFTQDAHLAAARNVEKLYVHILGEDVGSVASFSELEEIFRTAKGKLHNHQQHILSYILLANRHPELYKLSLSYQDCINAALHNFNIEGYGNNVAYDLHCRLARLLNPQATLPDADQFNQTFDLESFPEFKQKLLQGLRAEESLNEQFSPINVAPFLRSEKDQALAEARELSSDLSLKDLIQHYTLPSPRIAIKIGSAT